MLESIDQALYDTVHDYKDPITGNRGVFAVCTKIEELTGVVIDPGNLQHKVNPKMPTHRATLLDVLLIIKATGNPELLHEICHQLGFVCVSTQVKEGLSDVEFLNMFTQTMKEIGDVSDAINKSFSNAVITRRNVKSVKKETLEAIAALAELPSRLEAMCDD